MKNQKSRNKKMKLLGKSNLNKIKSITLKTMQKCYNSEKKLSIF